MSTNITRFRAILLGPAPIILPAPDQTARDLAVDAVIAAIPGVGPIALPYSAALVGALAGLTAVGTNCVADAAITAVVTAWVADIQQALTNIVPLPHGGLGYADDVLYIVSTPEFGLNAWVQDGLPKSSAGNPIPEALETSIVAAIQTMLNAHFSHVRVLFAISCCSYAPAVLVNAVDGTRRISGSSRITIITSYGTQRIPKLKPADIDGWSRARFLDARSVGSPDARRANTDEVRFILNFPHDVYDVASRPALGFSTCLDANTDDHGEVNICVYPGDGLPIYTTKDVTHPFLYNDQGAWRGGRRALMRPVGYYAFVGRGQPAPLGLGPHDQLGAMVVEAHTNPHTGNVTNLPEETSAWSTCYFYRPNVSVDLNIGGRLLYRQTTVLPFPAKMPDARRPAKKACSIL